MGVTGAEVFLAKLSEEWDGISCERGYWRTLLKHIYHLKPKTTSFNALI